MLFQEPICWTHLPVPTCLTIVILDLLLDLILAPLNYLFTNLITQSIKQVTVYQPIYLFNKK